MKKALIRLVLCAVVGIFFSGTALAKSSKKEQERQMQARIDSMPVYYLGKQPKRAYEVISPISDTSKTEQKSFLYMKKEAALVNADVIVDFQCETEKRLKLSWTWGQQSFANCKGLAARWAE